VNPPYPYHPPGDPAQRFTHMRPAAELIPAAAMTRPARGPAATH
jgi:hypothetical protein